MAPADDLDDSVNEAYPHHSPEELVLGYEVGYGRAVGVIEGDELRAESVRQEDTVPELPQDVDLGRGIGSIGCGGYETGVGVWLWRCWLNRNRQDYRCGLLEGILNLDCEAEGPRCGRSP